MTFNRFWLSAVAVAAVLAPALAVNTTTLGGTGDVDLRDVVLSDKDTVVSIFNNFNATNVTVSGEVTLLVNVSTAFSAGSCVTVAIQGLTATGSPVSGTTRCKITIVGSSSTDSPPACVRIDIDRATMTNCPLEVFNISVEANNMSIPSAVGSVKNDES